MSADGVRVDGKAQPLPTSDDCNKCSGTDEKPWCEQTQSEWCGVSNPELVRAAHPATAPVVQPEVQPFLRYVEQINEHKLPDDWTVLRGLTAGDFRAAAAALSAPTTSASPAPSLQKELRSEVTDKR